MVEALSLREARISSVRLDIRKLETKIRQHRSKIVPWRQRMEKLLERESRFVDEYNEAKAGNEIARKSSGPGGAKGT